MTTPITKFVTVNTRLASKVIPAATFENGLFLGCHEDFATTGEVPPDVRYLTVTKDDFADYLDPAGEAYAYALGYFAQDYTPDALILGRTMQAATSSYSKISGGVTAVATFEVIADGTIKFEDSDANTDVLAGIDFSGCTTYAQVLGKINTAIAAVDYPNIPSLENCTFGLDNLGRLCLFTPGTAEYSWTELPDCVQTYASYTGVTAGKIKFQDNATPTPNTVEISTMNFSACTTFAQVLGVINAKLAALISPAISELDKAVMVVDDGRVILQLANALVDPTYAQEVTIIAASATGTDLRDASYLGVDFETHPGELTQVGADARTVSVVAQVPGAGTELFTSALLGDTCEAVPGYDVETLTASLQAVRELVFFYNVATYAEEGATTIAESEYTALAAYIETQVLEFDFLTHDTDAKDALITNDLVSQLRALNLDRTTCYYTERTTQRPDGANAGYVFPQDAGSCSFAYNALSGISESGLSKTLTAAEMLALDGKHVVYFCQVADVCFPFKSLTCSGEEKRLILGIDWFNATCQIDIINDRLTKKIHTYDYNTFGAVESILYRNAGIAAARNILYPVDDKDYPFTVTMPAPTEFSKADKKTHIFNKEVFHGTAISEILQWQVSGTFEI